MAERLSTEFARVATAWIPLEVWREAARALSTDRASALTDAGFHVTLGDLPFATRHAVLRPLFAWLAAFSAPRELIEIARRDSPADADAWRWLAELSLSERYRLEPTESEPQTNWCAGPPTVSLFAEPNAAGTRFTVFGPRVLTALARPVATALCRMALRQIEHWQAARAKWPASATAPPLYFEPSHPGWFGTWVEAWTAEALESAQATRAACRSASAHIRRGLHYEAMVLPRFPLDQAMLQRVRMQSEWSRRVSPNSP